MACEKHRAYIYDRGGQREISPIGPLMQVRWGRVRDDVSRAQVVVSEPHPSCLEALETIQPGRHEMVIFRDGQRCWEGPVTLTTEQGRTMTIFARDVVHYLNRTAMRSAYNNAYPKIVLATERLEKIIRAEVQRKESMDPSYNILSHLDVRNTPGSAKTARHTKKYQHYVYDEMEAMAWRGGIDYTTIGRRIVINDVDENIGEGPLLTEADFLGDIAISTYGMEVATRSIVTDGLGVWGAFGGTDDYYGEIELLHSTYDQNQDNPSADALTAAEMTKQAQRNMSGRYPTPVILRVPDNSTLRASTVDKIIDLLVPGVRFPVRATKTFRQLQQTLKLDSVTFEETSAGESVSVTLSPAPGTTPWDDSGITQEEF